jgi:hypothetical protein
MYPTRTMKYLLPACVILIASCAPIPPASEKSPLAQPQMLPDSVALDFVFARFPFGDEQANEELWQEVDEQHLPAEVRQRLAEDGFRVGLVSGQPPMALSKLLELSDQPPEGKPHVATAEELQGAARVVRQHEQCRPGQLVRVATGEEYEELPVLRRESNESGDETYLCGRTYSKAQCVLSLKTELEPAGRIRVHLVPELHHGEVQKKFVGSPGVLRMDQEKEKQTLEELAFSAVLAPGEMLVLSGLENRRGSLGYHFFTRLSSGRLEQVLMVIRLSQVQHDDLFSPHPLDLVVQ